MKRAVLTLAMIGLWVGVVQGQLTVSVRMPKETFLLYEPIPVIVGLRNLSGRTLQLVGSKETPWLSFVVADERGSAVNAVGAFATEETVLIPPGQSLTRTVDVLPLYELRSRGNFAVQARVAQGSLQAISAPTRFTIVNGRELWIQTVGLPPTEKAGDEYRTYSLVARRTDKEDMLHICVRDEPHQLVYGVISLGGFIALVEPEARVDRTGHLHVLYQGGPNTYGYLHVDPMARIIERVVFSGRRTKPRLVIHEGLVSVRGGDQTEPRMERVMTQEELNPPPPPPPPPPKKKWWWPFGPRQSADAPAR